MTRQMTHRTEFDPAVPVRPCFTGKLFTAAGHEYFWNSAAGEASQISPATRDAISVCGNAHGGVDLARANSDAPDLRPHIANPYSDAMIAPALHSQLRMLVLEMTQNCNLACSYCIDGDAYGQKNCLGHRNLGASDAFAAVDMLARGAQGHDKPLILSFYGGEPLLRFGLLRQIVTYARAVAGARGVVFSITTNGTLLSDHVVDYLVSEGFNLIVSLDGPRAVHDRFRLTKKGAPTHDRIIAALDRIKQRHPEFAATNMRLSIVVMPNADLAGLQAFFDEMAMPVLANFVESYGLDGIEARGKGQPGLADLAAGLRSRIRAYRDTTGDSYLDSKASACDFAANLLRSTLEKMSRKGGGCGNQSLGQCLLGTSRLYVASDGAMYPCEKLAGHSVARIGDADTGLDPGKIARTIDAFYDMAAQKCDGCWMATRCSMCLALVASGDTISEEKFDHYCAGMKAAGAFSLGFNAELGAVE